MVNIAALERTITHIKDHPEKHKQGTWTCATGACMAGWAALLHGWEATRYNGWVVPPGMAREFNQELEKWAHEEGMDSHRYGTQLWFIGYHPHFHAQFVPDLARNILGITEDDAAVMFDAYNTADNLALMVKTLANGDSLLDHFRLSFGARGYIPCETAD